MIFKENARTGTNRFVNHSDYGNQYLSIRYTERLAEAGIESPVGSVDDWYENTVAETIIGLYNAGVIRSRGPRWYIDVVEYASQD